MTIRAVAPSEMTPEERADFITFVREANEVDPHSLPGLVDRAVVLVTIHHGQTLIGTSAIKVPNAGHRNGDFHKAGVADLAADYPLELGWIVVHPDHRRRGHGGALVAEAVEAASDRGIYATTKSDKMKRILPQYGFRLVGESYPSVRSPGASLTLFARPAGQGE